MKNQTNSILNAIDEGTAATVITLYEEGHLEKIFKTGKRSNIRYYLFKAGMKSLEDQDYWLDWFMIKD